MASQTLTREIPGEAPVRYIGRRPLRFEEFLQQSDQEDDCELLDGMLVRKMVAFTDHENLFAWLHTLLTAYTQKRQLGTVLGSRTAVEITAYRGRLPHLVFVRRENIGILRQEAIFGTPDLVIELVSPNDRHGDLVALEADYCSIRVPEIVFIDQRRRQVRLLRLEAEDYIEAILTTEALSLEGVSGCRLETEWLYDEPRPILYDLLTRMLEDTPG